MKTIMSAMNIVCLPFACLLAVLLAASAAPAADTPGARPTAAAPGTPPGLEPPPRPVGPVRFDLQFPGGTPEELVKAIEETSGTRVNAIIPAEHTAVKLPALRMSGVSVEDLFSGLQTASRKIISYPSGSYVGMGGVTIPQYQQRETSFGFRAVGKIWVFYHDKLEIPEQQKICRFYQLEPYLKTLKIEDITTAIQTGWKLQGVEDPPALNFHAETKLLISVGDLRQLQVIDDALKALTPSSQSGSEAFANRMNEIITRAAPPPPATPAAPAKPASPAKLEPSAKP